MQNSFFDHAGAISQALSASGGGKDDQKKKEGEDDKNKKVRTLMVGEAPGEDLGYDPDTIPTEPIPPEEDD